MITTKHAQVRAKQRGFSPLQISLIEEFGKSETVAGGATKIFFGKKEYELARKEIKHVLQLLDKVNGSSLIVSGDNIITMYKA